MEKNDYASPLYDDNGMDEVYAHLERARREVEARINKPKVTRAMCGNDWLRLGAVMGQQRKLCGPLWYEGELCVLFADTNIGKSLLAVQIADMIASGPYASGWLPELKSELPGESVLYVDFELSTSQFARRYSSQPEEGSDGQMQPFMFSNNFVRVELNYESMVADDTALADCTSQSFANLLISDIEKHIDQNNTRVLIIDNITFMAQGTEQAAEALPLMKKLISLKKKHSLSILVLAHTPKRNLSNPLTRNDLQGSKMIINFVDSAFAIGESVLDGNMRYIKQIKQRNTEQIYGQDNVLTCTIGRCTPQFVGFRSVGTSEERKHLVDRKDAASRREQARKMVTEGSNHKEIAAKLGISLSQAYRYTK